MRQRSLKRHWSGDGRGPRTGWEAWGFVVLLDIEPESKGPAVLLCFSGSGSLMPLFLFCRDVKSTSTEQRCSAARGWIFFVIRVGAGGNTTLQLNPFIFSESGKVTPLTLNPTLLRGGLCVLLPLFWRFAAAFRTLMHSSVKYGCLSDRKWLISGSI